jgi:hypothetical protein
VRVGAGAVHAPAPTQVVWVCVCVGVGVCIHVGACGCGVRAGVGASAGVGVLPFLCVMSAPFCVRVVSRLPLMVFSTQPSDISAGVVAIRTQPL